MSLGELIVIIAVSAMVFGPNKLPMLAKHLGAALRQFNAWKAQWQKEWQKMLFAQQLEENQQKAKEVDEIYRLRRCTGQKTTLSKRSTE